MLTFRLCCFVLSPIIGDEPYLTINKETAVIKILSQRRDCIILCHFDRFVLFGSVR